MMPTMMALAKGTVSTCLDSLTAKIAASTCFHNSGKRYQIERRPPVCLRGAELRVRPCIAVLTRSITAFLRCIEFLTNQPLTVDSRRPSKLRQHKCTRKSHSVICQHNVHKRNTKDEQYVSYINHNQKRKGFIDICGC
jgi:hypothetical protein